MATLSTLLAAWPKGMWESLIKIFYNGIPNYVWAIVVFTIVLKLILSPLDYLQRSAAAKTSRMQAYLKPEMDKLAKRYGSNQKVLQQKQAELYKKNNYNVTGSCLVMMINLILTLVIFFTLYSGLGNISKFKIKDQYQQLQTEYHAVYDAKIDGYVTELSQEAENAGLTEQELLELITPEQFELAKAEANQAVSNLYDKIKDNWLWVKNVWRADTVISVIPSYDEYVGAAGIKYDKKAADYKTKYEADKAEYDEVMANLTVEYKGGNGYYILPILAVIVTFLSQFFMRLSQRPPKEKRELMKKMGEKQSQPATNWIMMVLMPAMMFFFTMTSSAMFSVYIIINSLMSTLLTPLCTLIINAVESRKDKKREQEIRVDYRR